jgi:hypothetical protein
MHRWLLRASLQLASSEAGSLRQRRDRQRQRQRRQPGAVRQRHAALHRYQRAAHRDDGPRAARSGSRRQGGSPGSASPKGIADQPNQPSGSGNPTRGDRASDLAERFLRRRAVALTAITALIVIPAAVLVSQLFGGDDSNKNDLVIPATPHAFTDRGAGITIRWPDGWRQTHRPGAVKLVSKDNTTAILVAASTPATAKAARSEFRDVIVALRRSYRHPRVDLAGSSQPVSGLRTATATISGRNSKGVAQQVSAIVARGKRHVYLIEIIAPNRGGRLGDVALISRRLELRG